MANNYFSNTKLRCDRMNHTQKEKQNNLTSSQIEQDIVCQLQTLRWWVNENCDLLRFMHQIEQQARQWQQNNHNSDYLLRGTALARVEQLYIKYADELSYLGNHFIGECIQKRDRQEKIVKRRRRLTIGGLVSGLIIISTFASAAILQLHRSTINEINVLGNSAETLSASDRELDASRTKLKARRKIQDNIFGVDSKTKIKEFNPLESYRDKVINRVISPDGKIIASKSADNTIKLWDRQGNLLHTLESHADFIHTLEFTFDGRVIISTCEHGIIRLWNLNSNDVLTRSCN